MKAVLAERTRTMRKQRKLTQEELSEKADIGRATIARIETAQGKELPSMDILAKLGDFFGVSVDYLLGRDEPTPRNVHPIERKRIPILGHIAAGEPIYLDDTADLYTLSDSDLHCDFAMLIEGDSMEPRILEGDAVFIRSQDAVNDGEIAAVQITDEFGECYATLKHVYHLPNGVQLVSDNLRYKPMIFSAQNCDGVRILGKAVAYQRML